MKRALTMQQVLTPHSASFAPQCLTRMFKTLEAHIDEAGGTPDWMTLLVLVQRDEQYPDMLNFKMKVDAELPEGAVIGGE